MSKDAPYKALTHLEKGSDMQNSTTNSKTTQEKLEEPRSITSSSTHDRSNTMSKDTRDDAMAFKAKVKPPSTVLLPIAPLVVPSLLAHAKNKEWADKIGFRRLLALE